MAQNASNITIESEESEQMPVSLSSMPLVRASYIVGKIVLPIILVFGTFGNVMIIVIMNRLRSTVSSISVYFTALAVSDLVFIYTVVMRNLIGYNIMFDYFTISTAVCKIGQFLLYVTGVTSAWILVAMTVQRAASVVWPHRVSVLCTRRKSIFTVMGIVLFTVSIHSHILYGAELIYDDNGTLVVCCVKRDGYGRFMENVWSWVDLLSFSALPFLCLVASNGLLVKKLTFSIHETNLKLSLGQSDQAKTRTRKVSSVTVTLIAVSTTFILLNLPFSAYILLHAFDVLPGSDDLEAKTLSNFIYAVVNILWYCNSAVNFYLYCLTGSKFRTECLRVITCSTFPPRKEKSVAVLRSTNFTDLSSNSRNDVSDLNNAF